MSQIEPCRFCQSQAVRVSFVRISDEHQWHHVECGNCFAVGPHRASSSDAVEAWNHRIEASHPERDEVAHIVTWLRDMLHDFPAAYAEEIADAIERGDHKK